MGAASPAEPSKLRFRVRDRLTHAREFQGVFAHKLRKSRGPLTVFVKPNGLGHDRLGLSIGKRVGGAVLRGRVKRLLREAFRLSAASRAAWPGTGGYDLVVSSRAHPGYAAGSIKAGDVQRWLLEAAAACHREQQRRDDKPKPPRAEPEPQRATDV